LSKDILRKLTKIAGTVGFTKYAPVDLSQIVFNKEFRKMCEVNSCRNYGTNYMCPPHVGAADDCIAEVEKYAHGLLVQSIVQLEDSFDFEGMTAGQSIHDTRIRQTIAQIPAEFDYLFLGAGPCRYCEVCAVKDNVLCRNPAAAISSMEAYCIDVNKTLTNVSLKYNNGEATVSYVGLIMYT